jgi:hypothetical protein
MYIYYVCVWCIYIYIHTCTPRTVLSKTVRAHSLSARCEPSEYVQRRHQDELFCTVPAAAGGVKLSRPVQPEECQWKKKNRPTDNTVRDDEYTTMKGAKGAVFE